MTEKLLLFLFEQVTSTAENMITHETLTYFFNLRLSKACLAAMATLLKKQNPLNSSVIAWCPGGLRTKQYND